MRVQNFLAVLLTLVLAACAGTPTTPHSASRSPGERPASTPKGNDVVLFALGLIDTGYRFGGKNPEAGLDCSGMVTYIYGRAVGVKVPGSAADIAKRGRPVARERLRPGDLVFFNTRNFSASHVGIYIGDDRFVHAPSSQERVRIDRLGNSYFAQRFEMARAYFD
ncbi:MAG TPA: C40 family peptidase [Accumulibacter sp.]|nr:C40 family peptidase [Accumulibacter sp.]